MAHESNHPDSFCANHFRVFSSETGKEGCLLPRIGRTRTAVRQSVAALDRGSLSLQPNPFGRSRWCFSHARGHRALTTTIRHHNRPDPKSHFCHNTHKDWHNPYQPRNCDNPPDLRLHVTQVKLDSYGGHQCSMVVEAQRGVFTLLVTMLRIMSIFFNIRFAHAGWFQPACRGIDRIATGHACRICILRLRACRDQAAFRSWPTMRSKSSFEPK